MDHKELIALISQIKKYARPLEIAQIDHLFSHGLQEDVFIELEKYQNPDGGFGRALEPDSWNPNSSPITSWFAMTILRTLDISGELPMVRRLFDYLESTFERQYQLWPRLIPSNDHYPCAPWWNFQHDSFDLNPSASIAGFVLKYEKKNSKLYKMANHVVNQAIKYLKKSTTIEVHELRSIIDMANDLISANRHDLMNEKVKMLILTHMEKIIELDESKWFSSYAVKPSALIKYHPSLGSDVYRNLIIKELDLAMLSRNDDGVWKPTWNWGIYPDIFEKASEMWIGIIGFEYLRLIKSYDYIKK
ncbi:MAG: hypothetical protein JXC31_05380 [Acholeplasmataceae bacterium]|nr:hypothetical protein [Acholeplasmataceae bacterium]